MAVDEGGAILGTYYIKPNQGGGGAHVCNCGYIVGEKARGRRVAGAMCMHSQQEAVARGFRAMQFNFVVSTNETRCGCGSGTVSRWWERFRRPSCTPSGYVDAFVMYKRLKD